MVADFVDVEGRLARRLRSGRWIWSDESTEWGEFVSGLADWRWFVTLTFRSDHPVKTVRGAFRFFGRWVNSTQGWLRAPMDYVVAAEAHKSGLVHLHAVMALRRAPKPLDAYISWYGWFSRHGRAQVGPFRDRVAAVEYACKYLSKDPLGGGVVFSRGLRRRDG